ncbi:FISUMP domain-containing protein [Bacteroidota bacterium]
MKNYIYLFFLVLFLQSGLNAEWIPGDDFTDERDGQAYKTVLIGEQVWMAENLNIGTLIPTTKAGYEMSDNGIIEKYCWDNDEGTCDGADGKMKRGGFYEWMEAMQYWTSQPELPVRGICPEGWHIPSNDEWNELIAFLGDGLTAGQKMLVGGGSGFEALLTGYRCTMTGSFRVSATSSDTRTYFWTAEQYDGENAPLFELGAESFTSFAFSKSLGLCVRCIWDGEAIDVDETQGMNDNLKLKVIPNPFNSNTNITYQFNGAEAVRIELIIVDVLGNVVAELMNEKIKPGGYNYNFDSINLNSGVYFVVAKTNKTITQTPMIVMK